jgi:hypothetical protein
MTATQSLKLLALFRPLVKEELKAKELVTTIESIIEDRFSNEKNNLATKQDIGEVRKEIYEAKVDIIKWQVGTAIAIIGILFTILRFK